MGLGGRFAEVQMTVGVLVHSFTGLHESDNPSDPSHLEPTSITGTNVGGFAEILYKHDDVPVTVRFRTMFGDVTGFEFALGVAF